VRSSLCFGKIFSVQDNVGAEFLAIAYFDQRRVLRHDHSRGSSKKFALISERLGMIAGGSRDNAAFFLFIRKLDQRVARAAFLKTSGALQVVELAEDLHAGDLAQRNGWRTRRMEDGAFNALVRGLDVLERDHALPIWAQDRRSTRSTILFRAVERFAHFGGKLFGIERFGQEKHVGITSIAGMK